MTDEEIYVPMESNNLEQNAEVIIDFGGDTIIDNFSKRSLLNELSKRVSFALEEKAQLEALKCLSQLNFHEKSKNFSACSAIMLQSEMIPITNWIEKSFSTIECSVYTKQFPARVAADVETIRETIVKLKDLERSLSKPPNYVVTQNQDIFESKIKSDFALLVMYAGTQLDLCALILESYELFMKKLGQRRLTRLNQNILKNKTPIHIDLFYEILSFDLQKPLYSNILIKEDFSSPDSSNFQQMLSDIEEEDEPTPCATPNTKTDQIVKIASELLKIDLQSDERGVTSAIELVNEQFGSTLSRNDPNLLQKLLSIKESRDLFNDFLQTTTATIAEQPQILTSKNADFTISRLLNRDLINHSTPLSKINATTYTTYTMQESSRFDDNVRPNQDLGELLFPKIYEIVPLHAKKLVGMFLDLPRYKLFEILNSKLLLKQFTDQALDTLMSHNESTKNDNMSGVFNMQEPPFSIFSDNTSLYPLREVNTAPWDSQASAFQNAAEPRPVPYHGAVASHSLPIQQMHNIPYSFQDENVAQHSRTWIFPTPSLSRHAPPRLTSSGVHSRPLISSISSVVDEIPPYVIKFSNPRSQRFPSSDQRNLDSLQLSSVATDQQYSKYNPFASKMKSEHKDPGFSFMPKLSIDTDQQNSNYNPFAPKMTSFNPEHKDPGFTFMPKIEQTIKSDVAEVELSIREGRELQSSSFLIQRIINTIETVESMDAHQLQDLLSNMSQYGKSLEKFETKLSGFLKLLIENKAKFYPHHMNIYESLRRQLAQSEDLSIKLQTKLHFADSVLQREKITSAAYSHHETKQLVYKEFSGCNSYKDAHIYEFIRNLEENFKITKTSQNFKGPITKNLLKGQARLCVPDDMDNYNDIINLLVKKYGSPVVILQNILRLHNNIGKVPSRLCLHPNWNKIEEVAKMHLYLIRKAEALSINEMAKPQIFENSFRNHSLISVLPHEVVDDLKQLQNSLDDFSLYKTITSRFEQILQCASSNIDYGEVKRSKNNEEVNSDHLAMAYEGRPLFTVGVNESCSICQTLQRQDPKTENLFVNHIATGPNKRYYINNCPLYLKMSMKQKNEFIVKHNMCSHCLRQNCTTTNCGSEHLTPNPLGRKKAFLCQEKACRRRIELCIEHYRLNKELLDSIKATIKTKYNYEYNINLFTSNYDFEAPRLDEHNEPFCNVSHFSLDTPDLPPLLMNSTKELLSINQSTMLACDSKSIFIYSKIAGAGRPVSVLFDSGGGSSICLNSIPGFQFHATQNGTKPVYLQGIGQGRTQGIPYNMLLPLSNGHNVGIEVFAVKNILRPMSRIDLSPALTYFKERCSSDSTMPSLLNDTIQNAKIYDIIQGSLDLLLGVKHYAIFPSLVHTLQCGLSIFRMRLQPGDPQMEFCLGGPFKFLSSIRSMFPSASAMFQQIDLDLKEWRVSIPTSLALLPDQTPANDHINNTDEQIHSFSDESSCSDDSSESELDDDSSRQFWHTEFLRTMQLFTEHLSKYHRCPSDCHQSPWPHFDPSASSLRKTLGTIYRRYFVQHKIIQDIQMIKGAILHLENCPCVKPQSENKKPIYNAFISISISENFITEIKYLTKYFGAFYKNLKDYLIKPETGHITLLALEVPNQSYLYSAGKAFSESINSFLQNSKLSGEPFEISFKGIDIIDEKFLYLKPAKNASNLQLLHECLYRTFTDYGFSCDRKFTGHLTVARLKNPTFVTQIIKAQFAGFDFGSSTFQDITLRPIKGKSLTGDSIYKTLKFQFDATLAPNKPSTSQLPSSCPTPCESTTEDPDFHICIFQNEDFEDDTLREHNDMIAHIAPESECISEITKKDMETVYNGTLPTEQPSFALKGTSYHKLLKDLYSVLYPHDPPSKCASCSECAECITLARRTNETITSVSHAEDLQIKECIRFDHSINRYYADLPLKANPETALAPNYQQARRIYFRVVSKLNAKERASVLKSFRQLMDLDYVQRLSDFPQSVQDEILSRNMYVIPWQTVTKQSSITTPTRIVMNASSKTSTGRSLNSILSKGIPSLALLPLAITMLRDPFLLTLDLQKFYNSCLIPSNQYNLQCILWEDNLDPMKEPHICVVKTHMYGLVSSARILELCLLDLANEYKDDSRFYRLFHHQLYVDDGFFNAVSTNEIDEMKQKLDDRLTPRGFLVKGYAQSFLDPPDSISVVDGDIKTVNIIGMSWHPLTDKLKYKIKFDFKRNKVDPSIQNPNSINDLVIPDEITLRCVASICASIWDPTGFLTPWFLGVKNLLRESAESVARNWDDSLSQELKSKWVSVFKDMLKLQSVEFPRCSYPKNHPYDKAALVGFADFGKAGKVQVLYLLRQLSDTEHHVSFIHARSQLNGTKSVPCEELDSLSQCALLIDRVSNAFEIPITKALVTDSTVVSFWLGKDPIKLSPFHRRRVKLILENCPVENVFHIRSTLNIADTGTKNQVPIESIYPGSDFHEGPKFLSLGLEACKSQQILKPVNQVVLDPKLKPLALDGILLKHLNWVDDTDEQINALVAPPSNPESGNSGTGKVSAFAGKVLERITYSNYLINPLVYPWTKTVKIMSVVLLFLYRTMQKRLSHGPYLLKENQRTCNLRTVFKNLFLDNSSTPQYPTNLMCHFDQILPEKTNITYFNVFVDVDEIKIMKRAAIKYFIHLASSELGAFYRDSMLRKHTVLHNNIYLSKTRLLECDQAINALDINIQPVNLGINDKIPCCDRFSPVAIAIAMHYHRKICAHAGADRTYLASLEAVFIFQGQSLIKDIVRTCPFCRMKLKKKCQTQFGPINKISLTFSSVNMAVMIDLSGPYQVKTVHNSKTTRNSRHVQKLYVLHSICLTSYISTMVLIENYSTEAFIDGLHRIGCRYGFPSIAYTDASAAQLKALTTSKLSLISALGQIYQETGVTIKISGTGMSSHSRQGRIEKSIDLFQRFLQNKKIEIASLTQIQFDSVLALAQNHLNSMPLCTKNKLQGTVSSELVTPFSFLLGRRSNIRAPALVPTLPETNETILKNIEQVSRGMFKYFTSNIPNLLLRPKDYDKETRLNETDLVLFPFEESKFQTLYKLGIINFLEEDSDGQSRIAEIAYCNSGELQLPINTADKISINTQCRTTRKAVHSLVKIFSASDSDLNTDIDLINKYASKTKEEPLEGYKTTQIGPDISPELLSQHLSYLFA